MDVLDELVSRAYRSTWNNLRSDDIQLYADVGLRSQAEGNYLSGDGGVLHLTEENRPAGIENGYHIFTNLQGHHALRTQVLQDTDGDGTAHIYMDVLLPDKSYANVYQKTGGDQLAYRDETGTEITITNSDLVESFHKMDPAYNADIVGQLRHAVGEEGGVLVETGSDGTNDGDLMAIVEDSPKLDPTMWSIDNDATIVQPDNWLEGWADDVMHGDLWASTAGLAALTATVGAGVLVGKATSEPRGAGRRR